MFQEILVFFAYIWYNNIDYSGVVCKFVGGDDYANGFFANKTDESSNEFL